MVILKSQNKNTDFLVILDLGMSQFNDHFNGNCRPTFPGDITQSICPSKEMSHDFVRGQSATETGARLRPPLDLPDRRSSHKSPPRTTRATCVQGVLPTTPCQI